MGSGCNDHRLEGDLVAQALQSTNQSPLYALAFPFVEIASTQLSVGFPAGEEVVDHHQNGVSYSHQSFLLTPKSYQPMKLGAQVGPFALGRTVGCLDEGSSQPGAPLTGLSRVPFACAFVVPSSPFR
jgi:hypothetical protein